jgi:signal transduction histidine kinase
MISGWADSIRAAGRSLSARLLVIFFIGSMVYGYAARYAFTVFTDTDYLRQIVGAHIALHSEYILKDIGSPPDISKAEAIVNKIPVDIRIVGPGMDWSSSPHFYPLEKIPFGPLDILELGEANRTEVENWARQIESVAFARYHEHFLVKLENDGYEIVFASPRISEMPRTDYSTLIISLAGIAILFLILLAVRWVFLPIKWIQEGAERIGAGDLEYRIRSRRHDELGDLSRQFNTMAEDVQEMLEAKRQLMLAISHELRSPLTRSKVSAEFIEDETVRQNILEDLAEMERLTSDLLESEALKTRHAVLHREPVDLAALLESVIATDFVSQTERVSLECGEMPVVDLDITRIKLLMRNLIDNALRYNPADAGLVEVRAVEEAGKIRISVQDHGPGIPPEHIDNITEPFYRADPARARATGGIGLGLYLCRRIVEVHGGQLSLISPAGRGTLATVILPLQ